MASTPAPPATAEPSARLSGVSKRYRKILAVDNVDLEIPLGMAVGLLGPNGAGKSTLMHLLSGLLKPDIGRVTVAGLGSPTRRHVRREIGLAPQALALYPQLTALENLRFFARVHGIRGPMVEEQVQAGLSLADLGARADDRVGTFSGGMQRRLNLACAVLHRPSLLLLDEPTAGVDPQSRHHLYGAIQSLREGGLSILISTHLIDEAERLCDRVAIMDHGQLRDIGTAAELRERHRAADLQGALLLITGKGLRD